LSEANPVTGGMVFHVLDSDQRERNAPAGKRPRR
jgi:hypothetical protein